MKDLRYWQRVLALGWRDPTELLDRVRGQLDLRRDRFRPTPALAPVLDSATALHNMLGADPNCARCLGFPGLWNAVASMLSGEAHVAGTGYDGGRALAQAAYIAVRHLAPAVVIETGVARGVTSRVVLEALKLNGDGHLFSIDLPPLAVGWHTSSAIAVTRDLQPRWSYLRGTSRRLLPDLVRRLGAVPLFIHDSLHTYRNVTRELETVWPALTGLMLCDDVDDNRAFVDFASRRSQSWFIAREPLGVGYIGAAMPAHVNLAGRSSAPLGA
jgi:hypothetical protein